MKKKGNLKCYSHAIYYFYIRKDLDYIFLFDWKSTNLTNSNVSSKELKIFDYHDRSHCSIKIFAN